MSRTAIGVAAMRAVESRRPDRLFDDPYAQAFVEAGRRLFPELDGPEQGDHERALSGVGALFYMHAVVRTRFCDEFLLAGTAAGCAQVVLLAAGLDTRAFRLSWPRPVRLYELDLPEVLAFKQRVLSEQSTAPGCQRTTVPVDLRQDWAEPLLAAGFAPREPTVWLPEGLLIYLSFEEAASLLATVGRLSAPGSQLCFEHGGQDGNGLVARARAMPGARRWTTLFKSGLGERAPQWLTEHGWHWRLHISDALAARYGRPAEHPSSGGFLTATRDSPLPPARVVEP